MMKQQQICNLKTQTTTTTNTFMITTNKLSMIKTKQIMHRKQERRKQIKQIKFALHVVAFIYCAFNQLIKQQQQLAFFCNCAIVASSSYTNEDVDISATNFDDSTTSQRLARIVPESEASSSSFIGEALMLQARQALQSSTNAAAAVDDISVETFYLRKATNGTLPCLSFPSDVQSVAKVEWFKEDKRLMEADNKKVIVWNLNNSVMYLPESGSLYFRGVTNSESGEYHCVVTNTTGSTLEGVVRFYVQDVPDPPQKPIVVGYTQRSANVSWAPSFDYHYSPILHYIVHTREGENGAWDSANGVMTPDNRTQFEIIGLKPFTTYSFRVVAVNAIGASEPSPPSYHMITLRQRPDSKLSIISARNVSSTAVRLEWEKPTGSEIHGEFLGYRIRYVHQLHEHSAPQASINSSTLTVNAAALMRQLSNNIKNTRIEQPSLNGPLARSIIVGDPNKTFYIVKNLDVYTPYKFSVQVFNLAGDGPEAEVLVMTDEGAPTAPLELSVVKVHDTSIKLRWLEPRAANGILQGYTIVLLDLNANENDTRTISDPQSIMEHTIIGLKPFTVYKAIVCAFTRKFAGELSAPVRFKTDVSAPSAPLIVNLSCVWPEAIRLQWQRPTSFNNSIDFYYVNYKQSSAWNFIETTHVARTDKLLNELLVSNLNADELYEFQVLAGTKSLHDSSAVFKSEPSELTRVVLQPNCEGYTAHPLTESAFNTSLLIGIVCALFALILAATSLIFWRRHCNAAYYYLDDPQSPSRATSSPQLSETYDDTYGSIPVIEWSKHVEKLHADGDIGFSREFEQIQQASNLNLSSEHSRLLENKHKNRYINIVAYDHTRVTLRMLPGQKKLGSDYINANFIDGYNKPRAYIGTQGPLVSTFEDYWRMIWEQRVVIIVMITNLQERGRRKCDMYWPKEGTETYGFVQVKLLQEVVMATYILRTFTIKNLKFKKRAGGERTVYQYHYTNWPDHGVPDHPLPVLSFVRKSASANPPGAGAIICHCSAGCGRSGTYIVIDAMLKQIRHRQSINVFDFLKHIRSQRNYLVQTEEQYVFIHDAIVEAINGGETEIASNHIARYIKHLQTGNSNGEKVPALANGNQKTASSYSIYSAAVNVNNHQNQIGLLDSLTNNNQSIVGVGKLASNGSNIHQPLTPSAATIVVAASNATQQQQQPVTVPGAQAIYAQANGTAKSRSNLYFNTSTIAVTPTTQQSSNPAQWSLLERQFRLVASFKAKDYNITSALKPCNKNKNRTLDLIPLEAHRVHITPKPGVEGSDYINATFLTGFNHLREFIVAQHPVHETFSDFWQMVYDHNSQTIVLLTPVTGADGKDFAQFWPLKEDEVDYGSFKVKLTQEMTTVVGATESSNTATTQELVGNAQAGAPTGGVIITRDFIMRSNQDDYELQTRVIQCPGWPHCCSSLGNVFGLIEFVQEATRRHSAQQRLHDGHHNLSSGTVTIGQEHEPQNGGPIIVVDKFGGTEAATFAVLTTLYKQINFEDAVDVYMYAKLAHLRRPGIWRCQDDYLFLYRAIENYASRLANQNAQGNQNALSIQTMTLDRHRHKQTSNNNNKSSSTLRRPDFGSNKIASTLTIGRPQKLISTTNTNLIVAPTKQSLLNQTNYASNNNNNNNNINNINNNTNASYALYEKVQQQQQQQQQQMAVEQQAAPLKQQLGFIARLPAHQQQLQPVVSAQQIQSMQRQLQKPPPQYSLNRVE